VNQNLPGPIARGLTYFLHEVYLSIYLSPLISFRKNLLSLKISLSLLHLLTSPEYYRAIRLNEGNINLLTHLNFLEPWLSSSQIDEIMVNLVEMFYSPVSQLLPTRIEPWHLFQL
jgi:hypothetical protein